MNSLLVRNNLLWWFSIKTIKAWSFITNQKINNYLYIYIILGIFSINLLVLWSNFIGYMNEDTKISSNRRWLFA